ncbi:hypothetical protein ACSSVY_001994 [Roseovarius sp. MBR-51]
MPTTTYALSATYLKALDAGPASRPQRSRHAERTQSGSMRKPWTIAAQPSRQAVDRALGLSQPRGYLETRRRGRCCHCASHQGQLCRSRSAVPKRKRSASMGWLRSSATPDAKGVLAEISPESFACRSFPFHCVGIRSQDWPRAPRRKIGMTWFRFWRTVVVPELVYDFETAHGGVILTAAARHRQQLPA